MKTVAQELRRFLHKIDPTLTDQVYNKDDLAGYDALTASILSLPEFVEFGGFLKCGLSLVIIQLSCFRFSLFSTIQLLGIPHDFGNPKAFRRRLRPWMIWFLEEVLLGDRLVERQRKITDWLLYANLSCRSLKTRMWFWLNLTEERSSQFSQNWLKGKSARNT